MLASNNFLGKIFKYEVYWLQFNLNKSMTPVDTSKVLIPFECNVTFFRNNFKNV